MLRLLLLSIVAAFAAGTGTAYSHLGSPWHGNGLAAALGLNSVYLEIPQGHESATFALRYPIQENTFDYRVGNTSTVIVFSNDELQKQGFITEKSVVLANENGTYDSSEPSVHKFTINKSGYYHVLFGPGPSTSLLVIQSARTFDITPATPGAKVGDYLAPATSGDFHIVKHPTRGLREFAGWYSVFYREFTDVYRKAGLPVASDMDLIGQRALDFAAAVAERGYPQFANFRPGQGVATSPFIANVNGLSSEAFDTAYLEPGDYTFSYRPASIQSSIIVTNEVVLQVFSDDAFSKQYGTEADLLARKVFVANMDSYEITFNVQKAGFYHLSYAAGESGFIFSMASDAQLPTEITTENGKVSNHTRLSGVNSTIVARRPLLGGEWSVFFPCKIVQGKIHGAPQLAKVSVPFTTDTRLAVARFGSAIMMPLTIDYMKMQIDSQRRQLLALTPPRQ